MNIPRPIAQISFLLPWLAVFCFFSYLILRHVPPSGVRRFEILLDGKSTWFDTFLPGERVSSPGQQYGDWLGQKIFADPVYAGARLPGAYDEVDIALEIKPNEQPLLEIGVLRDNKTATYEMSPLWSKALASGWHETDFAGAHGFVRDGMPSSTLVTSDFDHVLTWYGEIKQPELMDVPGQYQETSVSLRGSFDLYAVPVNSELSFTVLFQDMNRSPGRNTAVIRFMRDKVVLWADVIGLGGKQDVKPNAVFQKNISQVDLKPGVYKLSISSSDDVFVRGIRTNAQRWVIGPRVYLGDTVGYSTRTEPIVLWTNSRHLEAETFHTEGLQPLSLGSAQASISQTHTLFYLNRSSYEMNGTRKVLSHKGDVRIIGDGYFAFTRDALFLPMPRRMTDASDPEREGIDAIITQYKQQPSMQADGWRTVHATFTLSKKDLQRMKYSIATPGLLARKSSVDVRKVTLTYRRQPLSFSDWWRYLRREFVGVWKQL